MAARKRPAVRDSSSPDPPETKARSASAKNNSSNKRAKTISEEDQVGANVIVADNVDEATPSDNAPLLQATPNTAHADAAATPEAKLILASGTIVEGAMPEIATTCGDATPPVPSVVLNAPATTQATLTVSATVHHPNVIVDRVAGILMAEGAENDKVSTLTCPGLAEPTITRINRLLTYYDPEHHVYTPKTLPATGLGWPTSVTMQQSANNYLGVKDTPMTLWIVGRVRYWKFMAVTDGACQAIARPCLGIEPVSSSDVQKVQNFLGDYSVPTKTRTDDATEVLWIQRWMGKWNTPVSDLKIFDNCYDGTTKWQGPVRTEAIPPTSIKSPDIVLVEAAVTRWSPKSQDGMSKKYDRKKWIADLQLERIVLLFSAPEEEAGGLGSKTISVDI